MRRAVRLHAQALTEQKTKLGRQQQQLLQAHYADAIPLDLLKAEQERVTTAQASIDRELRNLTADADLAKNNLAVVLDLLEDCATTYREAPTHLKRLLNQAFFANIRIDQDLETTPDLAEPFAALTSPS